MLPITGCIEVETFLSGAIAVYPAHIGRVEALLFTHYPVAQGFFIRQLKTSFWHALISIVLFEFTNHCGRSIRFS
jgi:hypothetical protein